MAKKSKSRRTQSAHLHTATPARPAAPTQAASTAPRTAARQQPTTAQPRVSAAQPRPVVARREAVAPPAPVDFASEYHYVLADLKHLGILAAVMFATLIVLALAL